jgi:hypothetical protein
MDMRSNTPPDFTVKMDRDDLDLSAEQVVVAYHERTKHHYHRYAASLGYLDWAKQPDPFRRYDGAPLVRLPLPDAGRALPYWQLYVADNVVPAPLSVDSISLFLRYAFSLTAWKQFEGTTWPLRANPSSGNLHPTEGYVLLPSLDATQVPSAKVQSASTILATVRHEKDARSALSGTPSRPPSPFGSRFIVDLRAPSSRMQIMHRRSPWCKNQALLDWQIPLHGGPVRRCLFDYDRFFGNDLRQCTLALRLRNAKHRAAAPLGGTATI